jgi:hypothetical protein
MCYAMVVSPLELGLAVVSTIIWPLAQAWSDDING